MPPRHFGKAHGRVSRANSARAVGPVDAARKDSGKDAPDGQCWGCWKHKREPWEHETWCPTWQVRTFEFSGS